MAINHSYLYQVKTNFSYFEKNKTGPANLLIVIFARHPNAPVPLRLSLTRAFGAKLPIRYRIITETDKCNLF